MVNLKERLKVDGASRALGLKRIRFLSYINEQARQDEKLAYAVFLSIDVAVLFATNGSSKLSG